MNLPDGMDPADIDRHFDDRVQCSRCRCLRSLEAMEWHICEECVEVQDA